MSQQTFDVDTFVFTSNIGMGGKGGRKFYYGIDKGCTREFKGYVSSLQAWCDSNTMRGLEVKMNDDSVKMFGNKSGIQTERFHLEGDKITSLKIWANRGFFSGRCGGFELTTATNRQFSVRAPRSGDPYQPPIGSGLLVGVFGRSGTDIDCLGFALLRSDVLQASFPFQFRI